MSQESEQAQEAWDLHTVRRNETIDMAVGYANGRDDYKAALKAEIEKLYDGSSVLDLIYKKEFLSLLDTVTPIK